MAPPQSCDLSGSPIFLGNANFSCIGRDLSGDYQLAEPVQLCSAQGLPSSQKRQRFTGRLVGAGHSLELTLPDGLSLFDRVKSAFIDLDLVNSALFRCRDGADRPDCHGDVALFGGDVDDSCIKLRINDSCLHTHGGRVALFADSVEDSNLTVLVHNSTLQADHGRAVLFADDMEHCLVDSLHLEDSRLQADKGVALWDGDLEDSSLQTLTVSNSRLSTTTGSVALFADDVEESVLKLRMHGSHLKATRGRAALFAGSVDDSVVELAMRGSTLGAGAGSAALFGDELEDSNLTLRMGIGTRLEAQGGDAVVVQELGDRNRLDMSMADAVLSARLDPSEAAARMDYPVIAGPIGHTQGSHNALLVHHSGNNKVSAEIASAHDRLPLTLASLGWGYMDGGEGNLLRQLYCSHNRVRAKASGPSSSRASRAHASLAGTWGRGGFHRLEQSDIDLNEVQARVSGQAAGIAVASLGLVHDASIPASAFASVDRGFAIRQQHGSGNRVEARVDPPPDNAAIHNGSLALASEAIATDDSFCGYRCMTRCVCSGFGEHRTQQHDSAACDPFKDHQSLAWNNGQANTCRQPEFCQKNCPTVNATVVQDAMADNDLVVAGGIPSISKRALVDTGPASRHRLFLFSGGKAQDSLWVSGDGAIECFGNPYVQVCHDGTCPDAPSCPSNASVINRAAYAFDRWDGGGCPGDCRVSSAVDEWKKVRAAFCETVPRLFDDSSSLCDFVTPCHAPGEKVQALLAAPWHRWWLVTRSLPLWPASAPSGLLRVLSLAAPCVSDGRPLNQDLEAGQRLYEASDLAVSDCEHAHVQTLLHSNGTLYLACQPGAAGLARLDWALLPPAAPDAAALAVSRNSTLPADARLLLLSEEEDGVVNLWTRRNGTTNVVDRWSLDAIAQQGMNATASQTFTLAEGRLLALARDGDWLYSLHESSEAQWQLQRVNMAGWQDPDWHHDVNASPFSAAPDDELQLTADHCNISVVPAGSLPNLYAGRALKPDVRKEGGCLRWNEVPQVIMPLRPCDPAARPGCFSGSSSKGRTRGVPESSQDAGAGSGLEGVLAFVATLVPVVCVSTGVAGSCLYRCQRKQWHDRARVVAAPPFLPGQAMALRPMEAVKAKDSPTAGEAPATGETPMTAEPPADERLFKRERRVVAGKSLRQLSIDYTLEAEYIEPDGQEQRGEAASLTGLGRAALPAPVAAQALAAAVQVVAAAEAMEQETGSWSSYVQPDKKSLSPDGKPQRADSDESGRQPGTPRLISAGD